MGNKKQPKTPDNVVKLARDPKMEYNAVETQTFLDYVFHDRKEGEEILTWFQKSNLPFYPQPAEATIKKMNRYTQPLTFYYGTSTCKVHEDDKLYNRKALFTALHVVVLDDIGTKVPFDRLPTELVPNYKIETSKGNFQYGFILKEAIRDLDLAEALIHLVYTSGVSDEGGKMPTKVVRLPAGINGKKGEKRLFPVTLTEQGGDYWTPDELLDVLDVGVRWSEVLEDINAARGGRSASKVGTSLWSPLKATAATLSGIVDPMLEWLYAEDKVINDNGEWVTIECPWSEDHTTGELTAGYSPLGRGGDDYSTQRGFKCMHSHGGQYKTAEFLGFMAAQEGAPEVSITDYAAELVANYALVTAEDSVYRLRGVKNPTCMKIGAFRNAYPRSVVVYDFDGKPTKTKEHALWLTAPNRLTLASRLYDPTSSERVVSHDGQKHLNTFTHPDWGAGDPIDSDIEKFTEFMEYLIPKEEERAYFLDWLAAKVQNVCFKGAAMLMVAPNQGTGRTTLTDMMAALFMAENVKKVNFDTLINGTKDGAFNDWQESLLVTCDEVMGQTTSKYTAYEAMKDMFDPRPKPTMINTKYGTKRQTVLYTSYLLLTNHADAIGALGGDRRVYVISNTMIPATPQYFTDLNDWLDIKDVSGSPSWCKSIWRMLSEREVDLVALHAPTPLTDAKMTMQEETLNINDLIARYLIKAFGDCIVTSLAKSLAIDILAALEVAYDPAQVAVICRIIKSLTTAMPAPQGSQPVINIGGKSLRIRLNRASFTEQRIDIFSTKFFSSYENYLKEARETVLRIGNDRHAVIQNVLDSLDLHDV